MSRRKVLITSLIIFSFAGINLSLNASAITIIIATTTSLYDSGFIEFIRPEMEKEFAVKLKFLAVGSGQALKIAADGNCDLVISHAEELEKKFLKQIGGSRREPFMYNFFILAGPVNDPLQLSKVTLKEAFKAIRKNNFFFVSRGDNSGTYWKEMALWQEINEKPDFANYIISGAGMQITLRIANQKKAYTLSDNSTFWKLKKVLPELKLIIDRDQAARNDYSIISFPLNNPQKTAIIDKIRTYFQREGFRKLLNKFLIDGQRVFWSFSE